ncbi:MAG: hypothetical protein SPL51_09820 [Lachnospiraceae bacterium]|nr:hypothetical protein [Lachnospiraceae bacterium]
MFFKRKKKEKYFKIKEIKEKKKYKMDYDYLAVPEIHTTGMAKKEDECEEPAESENGNEANEHITYDTVAMPEIHIHKKK